MNNKNPGWTLCDRTWPTTAFAILFVITFCSQTFGQIIANKQMTNLHLPKAMRKELVERFRLYIEYEKAQSYDKQFELVAKDHLATLLRMNVDKESYVKFKQESERVVGKLIDLKVKDVKKISNNPEQLSLSVVATLQKGEKTYSDVPNCVAYLVNGNWRFSLLYVN